MGRFAGRVALITGAGGAIGGAIARRLGAEGAAIAALDLDAARAEAIAAELGAEGIPALALAADVTGEKAVQAAVAAAVARFGRIDVLVNNAAMTRRARFEACPAAEWEAEVAVTLTGPAHLCRAVLPAMAARGAGAVVNIGSVNGMMYFGNPAYSAAKAGLLNFTRALAVEYGPAGVRVNMVSPGSVRTENPSWRARQARDPAIFARLARWYPLGRVGEPADIAAAVAFLAADEAGFVTGANLVVDGGLTAGMGGMAAELDAGAPD